MRPGEVLLDACCPRACAGRACHRGSSKLLSQFELEGTLDCVPDRFELGMSDAVISYRRWMYPMRVAGTWARLVIFELEEDDQLSRDMLALVDLDGMADWEMRLAFPRGRCRAESCGQGIHLRQTPSGNP